MRAGRALIEACEQDLHDRYFLIYPILFNYRQGLELAMKWIIDHYGRYARLPASGKDPGHNLWKLWQCCKTIICRLGSANDKTLESVERLIREFHELDRGGTAFRYARARDGNALKLPKYPVDLGNLRDVMEGLDHFFDGVDALLDANVSAVDWF